jgi:hypothetical protein
METTATVNGKPWTPGDELDGIALGTAEEERKRAKAWMDTAAQGLRDAEFWMKEAARLYRICKAAERRFHDPAHTSQVIDVGEALSDALTLMRSRVDGKMSDPDGQEREWVKPDPARVARVAAFLEKS